MISFLIPIRTQSELNMHEHWRQRQRRAKVHRQAAYLLTRVALERSPVTLPLVVTLTRIAPCKLDSDNNVGSCKHIRDGIADALGIDDGDERIEWRYAQEKGKPKEYGVKVEIEHDAR